MVMLHISWSIPHPSSTKVKISKYTQDMGGKDDECKVNLLELFCITK